MRPILVIAHEATRTGGPRVLLDLLTWSRDRLPAPLAVQLLADGPLAPELRALATTGHIGVTPALALANGAAAAAELLRIDPDVPAVAYVHEEGDALAVLPKDGVEALVDRCDRVLCVSRRSRDDLVRLGVATDRLVIVPPAVRSGDDVSAPDPDEVAEHLGLDPARPLVAGCGEAGWRKGADLFIDVARRVAASHPDVQFAWAGRRPRAFARILDNDTRAAGLADRLHWLGELDDAMAFLATARLVVMPSREDPQPLVPLEAAGWGTATAGFDIGGVGELAARGAAVAVPYPDTVALARAVGDLLADPQRSAAVAAAAADVRDRERRLEVVGEQFLSELVEAMDGSVRTNTTTDDGERR